MCTVSIHGKSTVIYLVWSQKSQNRLVPAPCFPWPSGSAASSTVCTGSPPVLHTLQSCHHDLQPPCYRLHQEVPQYLARACLLVSSTSISTSLSLSTSLTDHKRIYIVSHIRIRINSCLTGGRLWRSWISSSARVLINLSRNSTIQYVVLESYSQLVKSFVLSSLQREHW